MPRVPTWREVAEFCLRNGYETDERSHHTYYTREPIAGFISQTYLSRGAGNARVPTPQWSRVWRDQLRLKSESDFWQGLNGEVYHYDLPPTPYAPEPMRPHLARFLHDTLYYTDEQIASISPEEAQRMLDAYYSRPPPEKTET
jgi:hypothetical protein